jgi:membrane dipeptidase
MLPDMVFVDAHADTVMRTDDETVDFVTGNGCTHIDLPRALKANLRLQLFAVFAVRSQYPDVDLTEYASESIQRIKSWITQAQGSMQLVLKGKDLDVAFADHLSGFDPRENIELHEKKLSVLLGLEGADPLQGQAENVGKFAELGVRNVILAWDDNEFSGSSSGSGRGLTDEGRKLVQYCQDLHVMVDVSHLSDNAFWEISEMIDQPFIASHSNCRAVTATARNLTDEMIKKLADKGGVMGINLYPGFLSENYSAAWDAIAVPAMKAAENASEEEIKYLRQDTIQRLRSIALPGIEWVGKHILHAIQIGGEDCVGLGGDLDGISILPLGMTGIESYPMIVDALQFCGFNHKSN